MNSSTHGRPVVLVTGTSSGFGMLATIALARAGYEVIATMRNPEKQQRLLEASEKSGVRDRVHVMQLDVTHEGSISQCVQAVMSRWNRIDVLVNNAGYAVMGVVEEIPMDDWRAQLETNFFGTVSVVKAVLPYMRDRKQGKIINISSIAGLQGFPNMGAYAASKFAVEGFSESLRFELRRFHIYVSLIESGTFKTNMADNDVHRYEASSAYKWQADSFRNFKAKAESKAANPERMAQMIVKIATTRVPRLRYTCGTDAKAFVWMKRLLPVPVREAVIQRILG